MCSPSLPPGLAVLINGRPAHGSRGGSPPSQAAPPHPTLLLPAGEWENSCNQMQRMLVVRSLRPDRVAFCVTAFIVSNLGSQFIEPPVLNMKSVSEGGCRPQEGTVPWCLGSPECRPQEARPSSTLARVWCWYPLPFLLGHFSGSSWLFSSPLLLPLSGGGRLHDEDPADLRAVARRRPHLLPAPAGRAFGHGPALPRPFPGPGPGAHRHPHDQRWCPPG